MGRKMKPIDAERVAKLAFEGCSDRDIGVMLNVAHTTIERRFRTILGQKRAERRLELRRAQWRDVEAGDTAMTIFLGKNELNQSNDPKPSEVDTPDVPAEMGGN